MTQSRLGWRVKQGAIFIMMLGLFVINILSSKAYTAPATSNRQQLLKNAGFESGDWEPWQVVAGAPALDPIFNHSGSWSAQLGSSDPQEHPLEDQFAQPVDIPAGATDITWDIWYKLETREVAPNSDLLFIGFWDLTGAELVTYTLDIGDLETQPWTQLYYSLTSNEVSRLAGQTAYFGFYLKTDFTLPSQAWIDDTSLEVTAPEATPTPTATLSPTPTNTETPTPTPPRASPGVLYLPVMLKQ